MSEEERDRIIEEHEKNMAELESSLTLNKLKQRQKLEEKLAEKRKRKMEELERKQQEEEQVKIESEWEEMHSIQFRKIRRSHWIR